MNVDRATEGKEGRAFPSRGHAGWKVENDDLWQEKFEAFMVEASPAPSVEQILEASAMLLISVLVAFQAQRIDWKHMLNAPGNPLTPLLHTLRQLGILDV